MERARPGYTGKQKEKSKKGGNRRRKNDIARLLFLGPQKSRPISSFFPDSAERFRTTYNGANGTATEKMQGCGSQRQCQEVEEAKRKFSRRRISQLFPTRNAESFLTLEMANVPFSGSRSPLFERKKKSLLLLSSRFLTTNISPSHLLARVLHCAN